MWPTLTSLAFDPANPVHPGLHLIALATHFSVFDGRRTRRRGDARLAFAAPVAQPGVLRVGRRAWPLSAAWREQLARAGVPVAVAGEQPLAAVPGLAGSVVVGLCDGHFLSVAPDLRRLECRLVWSSLMTWPFSEESLYYSDGGWFDAHVFQSEFQRSTLEDWLAQFGYEPARGHLIRGPFDWEDWPFEPQPRDPAGDFVVGRLARPDRGKWSRKTWEIYGRIDHPRRRALVMGVDDTIHRWLGPARTGQRPCRPAA